MDGNMLSKTQKCKIKKKKKKTKDLNKWIFPCN